MQEDSFPFKLGHSLTPQSIARINAKLEAIVVQSDNDLEQFIQLIDQRAREIEAYIETLSGAMLKQFAENEAPIQTKILEFATVLQASIKNDWGNLVKGKNAVKKYR